MVIISTVLLMWSMLGSSGGLFVTPIITYPMAIGGGILIGYGVAPMVIVTESRLPRATIALIAALFAFTVQLLIFAVMNPGIDIAVDWLDLSSTWYPFVLAVVSVVIGLYEGGLKVNDRFALFP